MTDLTKNEVEVGHFDFDAFERAAEVMASWLARFRAGDPCSDVEPTENDRLTAGHLAGTLAANKLLAIRALRTEPAPEPAPALVCGPCGQPWQDGMSCGQKDNDWPFPTCFPAPVSNAGEASGPSTLAAKFCRDGRRCFGFCESDGYCPAGRRGGPSP